MKAQRFRRLKKTHIIVVESLLDLDYMMSGTNALCSDENRMGVYNIKECQEVANALEYQYMGNRQRIQYPKGCYFLHDTKSIYFNTDSTGQENRNAEQICKGKGN